MYKIIYNDTVVGTAEVKKEGLYLHFVCKCAPPDKELYRIQVSDGVDNRNLGICVPEGNSFYLNTRVPSKHFANEQLSFRMIPARSDNKVIPVATDVPFEDLEQLKTARFQIENGQPGILIDPVPDQPDSGQSPECGHRSQSQ